MQIFFDVLQVLPSWSVLVSCRTIKYWVKFFKFWLISCTNAGNAYAGKSDLHAFSRIEVPVDCSWIMADVIDIFHRCSSAIIDNARVSLSTMLFLIYPYTEASVVIALTAVGLQRGCTKGKWAVQSHAKANLSLHYNLMHWLLSVPRQVLDEVYENASNQHCADCGGPCKYRSFDIVLHVYLLVAKFVLPSVGGKRW
jgi:hypothetical protein